MLAIHLSNAYEIDFLFTTLFSNDSSVFFCSIFGNLSGLGAIRNITQSFSESSSAEISSACSLPRFTGRGCTEEAAKSEGMRVVKLNARMKVIIRNEILFSLQK